MHSAGAQKSHSRKEDEAGLEVELTTATSQMLAGYLLAKSGERKYTIWVYLRGEGIAVRSTSLSSVEVSQKLAG